MSTLELALGNLVSGRSRHPSEIKRDPKAVAKDRVARLREHNLCLSCRAPSDGKAFCAVCREKQRVKYLKKKAAGQTAPSARSTQ